MSIQLPTNADYVYRGTTATPGTQANPDHMSICGLLYLGASTAGTFRTLVGFSKRFSGGQYSFYGQRDSNAWDGDFNGAGTAALTTPTTATWIQFAQTWARGTAGAPGVVTIYWKEYADVAWHSAAAAPADAKFGWTPDRFFLAQDEFGVGDRDWSLSNVRVWDAVLSAADLIAEANSTTPIITADLFAWWKMRTSCGLLVDSSGNGNDLVAVGTPVAGADSGLEAPDCSGVTISDHNFHVHRVGRGALRGAS